MARLIYACRFEVAGSDGYSYVVQSYRDWIERHYRERRGLASFAFDLEHGASPVDLPSQHRLIRALYENNVALAMDLQWSFPADDDPRVLWSNHVRIGKFGDQCSVEHAIFIEAAEYIIAPVKLAIGSPRVVRDICLARATRVGDLELRAAPYHLSCKNTADFLALLESERRLLPLILLTPYARGDANLIDAAQLARNLAGAAVVVEVVEAEACWDLAEELGRRISCFNGAARIYWPGFSRGDDFRRHRLYLGAWIEQVGPTAARSALERAVFAVAAFRFVPDKRISDLRVPFKTGQRVH